MFSSSFTEGCERTINRGSRGSNSIPVRSHSPSSFFLKYGMEPDPNSPEALAAKRLSLLRRDFSLHQEKLLVLNKFLLQVKERDCLLDASRAKGKGVTELPSSSRFFHVYLNASFCLGKAKLMLDMLGGPDE